MRAPARVIVIAEIEEHVAVEVPVECACAVCRRVRFARQPARQEHQLSLVTEGASREQRAHCAL